MICQICHIEFRDTLGKFALEKTGKCPECYKKWIEKDESNPDLIKFEIEYELKTDDSTYIYAKTMEEAREKFSDEYDFTSINSIEEIKREGFGKQTQ